MAPIADPIRGRGVDRAPLARPRLLDKLRRRWFTQVTVVSAPAGHGKTTLLAQALAQNDVAPLGIDYLEAGVDCVYPIALWESDALRRFTSEVRGPVNVIRLPQTPSLGELAALDVARVSWATLLYRDAIARYEDQLASLRE